MLLWCKGSMVQCSKGSGHYATGLNTRTEQVARQGNPDWRPGSSSPNPGGRPPGTPNRVQAEVKAIIAGAANLAGGAEALVAWAYERPENTVVFWRDIVCKVLPKIVDTTVDATVNTEPRPKTIEHFLVSPNGTVVDREGQETRDRDGRLIMDPLFLQMHDLSEDEVEH